MHTMFFSNLYLHPVFILIIIIPYHTMIANQQVLWLFSICNRSHTKLLLIIIDVQEQIEHLLPNHV